MPLWAAFTKKIVICTIQIVIFTMEFFSVNLGRITHTSWAEEYEGGF